MRTIRKVAFGILWSAYAAATLCPGADWPQPQYPVIFIHGLAADAHLWDQLSDYLTNHGWTNGGSPRFVKATWPTNDSVTGVGNGTFYTMNMSDYAATPFRSQTLSFEQQGFEVGKVIGKVKSVTGQPQVILVCHSMGGLAARAYLEGLAAWDATRSMTFSNDVAKLITVGTPHLGSPLAEIEAAIDVPIAWLFGVSATNLAALALEPGSPSLNHLNGQPLPTGVEYVSIVSWSWPAQLFWVHSTTDLSDGIVSYDSQNLANVPSASGCNHVARPVQLHYWDPVSWYETHSYEPNDLSVWDELNRQMLVVPNTLKLNVVANPSPVRPGEQINYVMTVVNQGTNDLSGVEMRLAMPAYMVSMSRSGGTWESVSPSGSTLDSGDIVTWNLGTLPAGRSCSVVFAATMNTGGYAPTNGTVIPTTAMVVAGNGASAVASAIVIADGAPALVLSLTGDRNPVRPGETLTYTLSYGNPGAVSLSGVTLRAVVPAGTTFVSANEGGVLTNSEVIWDLGTVSVGAGGQRTFSVSVNGGLTNGTTIAGHAEIGGGEGRADTAAVVQTNPVLALTMTATPDPVRPGEQINYVMTVVNRGAVDLAGVKLRQLMPAYMVDIIQSGGPWESVSGNNSLLDSGDIVTWNLGTLPAGQSRSVVLAATMNTGSYAPPYGTVVPSSAEVSCTNIGGTKSAVATRIGNTKPSLTAITNQFVNAGSTISFTATASDPDVPAAQILSFSLPVGASLGATINHATGVFSWTPSGVQVLGVYSFTIRVTDNGTPSLSDEKSFTITVEPAGPLKLISPTVAQGKFTFTWITQAGKKYQAQYKTNLNDPDWLALGSEIIGDGTPASVTNAVGSASQRFFRVVQVP